MNFITSQWLVSVKKHRDNGILCVVCYMCYVCILYTCAGLKCHVKMVIRVFIVGRLTTKTKFNARNRDMIYRNRQKNRHKLHCFGLRTKKRLVNLIHLFFLLSADRCRWQCEIFFTHRVPCAFCHFSCLTTYFSISLANFCIRFNSGM